MALLSARNNHGYLHDVVAIIAFQRDTKTSLK